MKQASLILASSSTQRIEILKNLGIQFRSHAPQFTEFFSPEREADQEALFLATEKARSVAEIFPADWVLAADTLVAVGKTKIGKAKDQENAFEILVSLRNRCHKVYTALALFYQNRLWTRLEMAEVEMRDYSDFEILDYLKTEEWIGKAGAYAIQGKGASLVASISGDQSTVVGLPVLALTQLLEESARESGLAPNNRDVPFHNIF